MRYLVNGEPSRMVTSAADQRMDAADWAKMTMAVARLCENVGSGNYTRPSLTDERQHRTVQLPARPRRPHCASDAWIRWESSREQRRDAVDCRIGCGHHEEAGTAQRLRGRNGHSHSPLSRSASAGAPPNYAAAEFIAPVGGSMLGGLARRDLVAERLKHMVVLVVDDRDVDRLGGQRLGGRQSGEPRPDHHDAGLRP